MLNITRQSNQCQTLWWLNNSCHISLYGICARHAKTCMNSIHAKRDAGNPIIKLFQSFSQHAIEKQVLLTILALNDR